MTLAPLAIVYLGMAAFGTAVINSVGGFAGALLMAIAIAPVIGVKATVPVVATAMIISHSSRAFLFRRKIDWRVFANIFFVALPFILLGIALYIKLPERAVAMFFGCFLIAMIAARRLLADRDLKVGPKGLAAIAVFYGFFAGTSFGAGLILGPFLLGAGVVGETLIATVAALGLCLNLVKTAAFGLSPFLTGELALMGALIGFCTIPGHAVGRWIVRNSQIRVHTLIVEAVMLAGAAHFLWRGLALPG